jgi:acetyl-CoA acetyltransferase
VGLTSFAPMRDRAAVIGVGRTPMWKDSGRTTLSLAVEAIAAAVADAGLSIADIDGIAMHHANDCAPIHEIAAAAGLTGHVRWFHEEQGGGSKAPVIVGDAAMAIATGAATHVVVLRALNGRSGMRMGAGAGGGPGGSRSGSIGDMQYLIPYGVIAPVQSYAFAARMHMNRFGTIDSQLGAVAVQQRSNAGLNPIALMREPITLQDHAASPWIAEPFRKLDCCLETDGACAVVLGPADRAPDGPHPPVTITAWASGFGSNGFSNTDGDLTSAASGLVAGELYRRAGIGPSDMDIAELYDAFSFTVLLQLEEYGFCAKGESGPLVESGATALDGSLPVNTHGGFLSEGYVHGINHLAEAVVQLRGEAGPRQVEGCETALVSAQPGFITGLSSGLIVRRA